MPERSFDALDTDRRRKAVEYEPGYDWIQDRFGPPPGISRDHKLQLDNLPDQEFCDTIMDFRDEEKLSLMVDEKQRRRTFHHLLNIETEARVFYSAKGGFYHTGILDRLRCAFCKEIVKFSETDTGQPIHSRSNRKCPIVRGKPCPNIPIGVQGPPDDLLNSTAESKPVPVADLDGFQTCKEFGYREDHIRTAYQANKDLEFDDQTVLLAIVQELDEDNSSVTLDEFKRKQRKRPYSGYADTATPPSKIPDLIMSREDLSEEDSIRLVNALQCRVCKRMRSGAITQPCGCFCLCQACSRRVLPRNCPVCKSPITGAYKTFLP